MGSQPWSNVRMQIAVLCVLVATSLCQLTSKQSSNPTCNEKENMALALLLERLESAEEKIQNQALELNEVLDQLENLDEDNSSLQERLFSAEEKIQNQALELNEVLDQLENLDEDNSSLQERLFSAEEKIQSQASQLNQALDQLENIDEASLQERLQSAEEKIQSQASQLNQALDQLEKLDEEKEAIREAVFTARGLGGNYLKVYSAGERLIYLNDDINPGSHYSTQTGEYTCPVNGTYFFTFFIFGEKIKDGKSNSQANASLFREGIQISKIYFANSNSQDIYMSMSGSDIVECNKGDKVWVQTHYGNNKVYCSSYYNSFSGMLLHVTEAFTHH